MSVQKSKLQVAGEEYRKEVVMPSCKALLKPTNEELLARIQIETKMGETILVEGQKFVGYSACVKSTEEVQTAYDKVKSLNTEVQHVLCAYSVPGRNFYLNKDCVDDDEHSVSESILNMLVESEIENRAVFVARYYDGTHIGEKCVEAILRAARSAIVLNPFNFIVDKHQYPLTEEETEAKKPLMQHGRGGGQSGRGGRRGFGPHTLPRYREENQEEGENEEI